MVLLRAAELGEEMAARVEQDPSCGWGRLAPSLALETTAGDHFSLMEEPRVADLAGKLGWALGAD